MISLRRLERLTFALELWSDEISIVVVIPFGDVQLEEKRDRSVQREGKRSPYIGIKLDHHDPSQIDLTVTSVHRSDRQFEGHLSEAMRERVLFPMSTVLLRCCPTTTPSGTSRFLEVRGFDSRRRIASEWRRSQRQASSRRANERHRSERTTRSRTNSWISLHCELRPVHRP